MRDALIEHQPRTGLHGHTDESRAAAKVDQIIVPDPGSTYREGVLRGMLVTLDLSRVSYQFTSG